MRGFSDSPSGDAWCRRHTALADNTVKSLFRILFSKRSSPPDIAVVAVGGYGRRELAPKSDIDITFIPLDETDPDSEQAVREMFRCLIDLFAALAWPVGYAYRLISDCPALDPKTRTSLLDARLITGSREALDAFRSAFWDSFPVADFLISKLGERREMRSKWHDTPRVVEFNLKEGAGGLRDLQSARWFAQVLGHRSLSALKEERELLLLLRNALHIVTGRQEDTLLGTRTVEVASLLKKSPIRLVDELMRAGEKVETAWELSKQRIGSVSFPLAAGVQAQRGVCRVAESAKLADAAVGVCRATHLGLKIPPAPNLKQLGDAPLITECVTSGENALRALEKAGLLDKLVPEFGACRHLLSRDPMHLYSVGEHTLRVIAALDRSRLTQGFDAAWSEVTNPRPLYLAALLHDVGKITEGRSHSETGAEIASKVCKRIGVVGDEQDSTVWLVREHLTLAKIARTHDLGQPETARELGRICGRQDRLAMLYLLTYADTSSVSDEAWTPQMSAAAAELYAKTRHAIGREAAAEDSALYRNEAMRRLQSAQTGDVRVEEFLETMPTHYLLATPLMLFPLHADYVQRARAGEMTVAFHHQTEAHTTDVTICTRDLPRPGLLSRILGVIYAMDLTLHSARAASTIEKRPVALDVLSVSYRGQPLPAGLCRVLSAELKSRLKNTRAISSLLRKHGKDPSRQQTMLKHRFHEGPLGVLEIETPLGRGMPYRVAKTLAGLGWNIHVARIGQWAGRAVARFYLDLPGRRRLTKKAVDAALKT